jgi:hypothetical protein
MKLSARSIGTNRKEVVITVEGTTINLGLLNDAERNKLAEELIDGLSELGPINHREFKTWLNQLLKERCGIELK